MVTMQADRSVNQTMSAPSLVDFRSGAHHSQTSWPDSVFELRKEMRDLLELTREASILHQYWRHLQTYAWKPSWRTTADRKRRPSRLPDETTRDLLQLHPSGIHRNTDDMSRDGRTRRSARPHL